MTHPNGIVDSSAVFQENVGYCHSPAKTFTFSNISVIIEDIYLKLRVVVHYQKGRLCPFFDLQFSKCSYS